MPETQEAEPGLKQAADYGSTTTADDYVLGITMHPWIPQSDAKIVDLVRRFAAEKGRRISILDAGCGPGRLAQALLRGVGYAAIESLEGVDASPSFIQAAQQHAGPRVHFTAMEIARHLEPFGQPNHRFDVVVMQGVLHHLHGETRERTLAAIRRALAPGGMLIVGDEVIPPYGSEGARLSKAVLLYLSVIAEGMQGGCEQLVNDEVRNCIEEILRTTTRSFAGNEDLKLAVQLAARWVYPLWQQGGQALRIREDIVDLISRVQLESPQGGSPSRGDRKVSFDEMTRDCRGQGFALAEEFFFGPVQTLGGMAVCVFR